MRKTLLLATIASLISLGAVFSVSAWQGEKMKKSFFENSDKQIEMEDLRAKIAEKRQSMGQAMQINDYKSWLELKADRSPCGHDLINEENFALFSKAHQLLRDGEIEEAREIFASLGKDLPNKQMGRAGHFRAEGERPYHGRQGRAPWGNNLQNQ